MQIPSAPPLLSLMKRMKLIRFLRRIFYLYNNFDYLEDCEVLIEKRTAELRRLSQAVTHSPSTVMITDAKGGIEYVNPKFTQLTGYTLEEVRGKNPRILKSGEQPQEFYKQLWETIASGREWCGEFRNKKKNGQLYWEYACISSVKDKEGRITNFIAVKEDITERKRLEELRDEFISIVSHELRSPMTLIREGVAQVEEGMHGPVTAGQKEFLSISLKHIDRLTRIINNLLDISKIESGKMELRKSRFDMVELIKGAVITALPKAKEKNLEIQTSFSSGVIEAYADEDKITQVVTNLVNNAIKFTGKGHILISLTEKEDLIECSVSDTGIGILSENLPKIFSKFEQVARLSGPGEKGTGLGLSIAKGIIELHQGRIWVESQYQKGSKFIFTLPKA